MDADLKALEKKLTSLIAVCTDLRTENAQLRVELDASVKDASALKANMAEASDRIEALMGTLP
jgi:cell division protein ZapB